MTYSIEKILLASVLRKGNRLDGINSVILLSEASTKINRDIYLKVRKIKTEKGVKKSLDQNFPLSNYRGLLINDGKISLRMRISWDNAYHSA